MTVSRGVVDFAIHTKVDIPHVIQDIIMDDRIVFILHILVVMFWDTTEDSFANTCELGHQQLAHLLYGLFDSAIMFLLLVFDIRVHHNLIDHQILMNRNKNQGHQWLKEHTNGCEEPIELNFVHLLLRQHTESAHPSWICDDAICTLDVCHLSFQVGTICIAHLL